MSTKRRLAAIMFTDVVGYTSIMGQDEATAVRMLDSHQTALEQLVDKYDGKIIQYYGDGSLSLFDSAANCVQCAMELQIALQDDQYVPLRVGMHIGEILEKDGKIFGDGVNIASRIESSGHAGTVLLSQELYNKVRNQAGLQFDSLGMFTFKNVDKPMEVFALTGSGLTSVDLSLIKNRSQRATSSAKRWITLALVAAAVLCVVFMATRIIGSSSNFSSTSGDTELQRIAVFPFNVKGPSELNYLSEGLVDVFSTKIDFIEGYTALDPNTVISASRENEIIGRSVQNHAALAEELGANQFIIGNFTAFGNDLRIKVTHYDENGNALSTSENVFNDIDGLLEAVDVVARETVATQFEKSGRGSAAAQILFSDNLQALSYFLKGEEFRRNGKYREASQQYTKATDIDSTMAMAWVRLQQVCAWNFICPVDESVLYSNAIKYRNNLPPKFREYIIAEYMTSEYSGPDGKIAAFRSLIDKYGESTENLAGLGEALYHAPLNPETSSLDALPYFLKAFELDPGNTEIVNHVAQLLAQTGDSAKVRQIRDRMSPESDNWAVFASLYLFMSEDEWSLQQVKEIFEAPGFDMASVFLKGRSDKYLKELVDFFDDCEKLNNGPIFTPNVPAKALTYFWQGTENQIYFGDNGFAQSPPGMYSTPMYYLEDDWPAHPELVKIAKSNLEAGATNRGIYPDDFVLAIIAMAQSDDDAFQAHFSSLREIAKRENRYDRCVTLTNGLYLRKQGDFIRSNEELSKANKMYESAFERLSNSFLSSVSGYYIAENYASMGQYENALNTMNDQFSVMVAGDDRLVARSLLRRGELCAQLDKHSEALDFLDRFLRVFADSDPQYADWMERAQTTRQRVVDLVN